MQQSHTAVTHTAGYHPLLHREHGAGDVIGLLVLIVFAVAIPTFVAVFTYRILRWVWRKTG